MGFVTSKADISLFFYAKASIVIYLLVYVDDIIVVTSSPRAVDGLLVDLKVYFSIKDLVGGGGCISLLALKSSALIKVSYFLKKNMPRTF
jgi:hypothetical protein